MKQTEILVICTHQEILNTIVRLINSNSELHGIGANTLEQAITLFKATAFDMVLVGAGLAENEETELAGVVNKLSLAVPVVHHYGGGSGLLFAEIYQCLGKR
ncbi:hypothetical protein ATK78_4424 [Pedobacter metabolipauper]|uniref:Response regulatory domain-containing protein n=2 Tax=Pedobacter metabolipauper TaxID=425513 RepID=A0A4R6SQ54_9SPHI|nr:hypothetical protein ATK78_4424 [Pedobacter metabolipauper]